MSLRIDFLRCTLYLNSAWPLVNIIAHSITMLAWIISKIINFNYELRSFIFCVHACNCMKIYYCGFIFPLFSSSAYRTSNFKRFTRFCSKNRPLRRWMLMKTQVIPNCIERTTDSRPQRSPFRCNLFLCANIEQKLNFMIAVSSWLFSDLFCFKAMLSATSYSIFSRFRPMVLWWNNDELFSLKS